MIFLGKVSRTQKTVRWTRRVLSQGEVLIRDVIEKHGSNWDFFYRIVRVRDLILKNLEEDFYIVSLKKKIFHVDKTLITIRTRTQDLSCIEVSDSEVNLGLIRENMMEASVLVHRTEVSVWQVNHEVLHVKEVLVS